MNTRFEFRSVVLLFALLVLSTSTNANVHNDGEFESYKARQQSFEQEYAAWRKKQNDDYRAYRKAYHDALKQFKDEILKHWNSAEVTDKKSWVEYSSDMKTRKVVDYERNEIRISILKPPKDKELLQSAVADSVKSMIRQNLASAKQNDPILQAVRKQSPKLQPTTDNTTDKKRLILSELFIHQQPSSKELQAVTSRLVQNAQYRKTAKLANRKGSGQSKSSVPVVVTIPLPKDSVSKRANKFRGAVNRYADQNNLDPSLVYAIMHTESSFNPMARSSVPAYGLMQIVPHSAGRDVSKVLFGKDQILSSNYLYQPNNNIQAGATYLNILNDRYLKGIKDPTSRFYCTIAAYNTGAGNVAKAYTGTSNLRKALPYINRQSPAEVYEHLIRNLPYEETKKYLKKVVTRQKAYAIGV